VTPETDWKIQSLLRELDQAIPREGHLEILRDPEEYDDTFVRANKHGYLRFGVELLKAAYAPPKPTGSRELVDVDLGCLEGFDANRFTFERREDVLSPIYMTPTNGVSQSVGWVIGLCFFGLLGAGVYTVFGWLVGLILRIL
jgi:hypothetical protein